MEHEPRNPAQKCWRCDPGISITSPPDGPLDAFCDKHRSEILENLPMQGFAQAQIANYFVKLEIEPADMTSIRGDDNTRITQFLSEYFELLKRYGVRAI